MANVFALLRLLPVGDRDKDAEILALRHQITVLERQLGKARPRFSPVDRAFLAALLHRRPRDMLSLRCDDLRLVGLKLIFLIVSRAISLLGAARPLTRPPLAGPGSYQGTGRRFMHPRPGDHDRRNPEWTACGHGRMQARRASALKLPGPVTGWPGYPGHRRVARNHSVPALRGGNR